MRGTIIFAALILAAPVALAQDAEPTVNDTDYDTTPPADDQSYIDEAEMETTTMDDGEFDTSLPADDQSYITDEVPGSNPAANAGTTNTPGLGILALAGAIVGAALLIRRR